MTKLQNLQLTLSDIITFHSYEGPEHFEQRVLWLKRYGRPILCTEYMARPAGSIFQAIMPIAKKYGVGVINWGLANGRTQTHRPWKSWAKENPETDLTRWFHDVFYEDGTPYDPEETDYIRQITLGATAPVVVQIDIGSDSAWIHPPRVFSIPSSVCVPMVARAALLGGAQPNFTIPE